MSSAYGLFTALQHATCHVPRYRDHGLLHRDHGTVVLCHPRCMRRYWLYSCRYHFPLNLLYFLAGDVPVFLASYEYLASARSTYLRPFDTDAFVSITGSARTDSCTHVARPDPAGALWRAVHRPRGGGAIAGHRSDFGCWHCAGSPVRPLHSKTNERARQPSTLSLWDKRMQYAHRLDMRAPRTGLMTRSSSGICSSLSHHLSTCTLRQCWCRRRCLHRPKQRASTPTLLSPADGAGSVD